MLLNCLSEIQNVQLHVLNIYIVYPYRRRAFHNMKKEAMNKYGKNGYGIFFGNCETFVNDCRYGIPVSFQVFV